MNSAGLLTLVVAVAIAAGTLALPGAPSQSATHLDKLIHTLAFALLVLPLTWKNLWHAVWLVPVSLAYGGGIELIQPHVGRSAEWADFLADGIGVAAGLIPGVIRARWCAARV